MQTLVQHALEETLRLLEIPSPTGHTQAICDHLARRLSDMGFVPVRLRKGGVLCTLGGEGRPLALSAHVDTLGLMVRQIKDNGRLAFARVGGVSYQALETENVQVFAREITPLEELNDIGIEHRTGYELTMDCLKRCPNISGIVAVNDFVAYGVLDALEDKGLKVPDDYSVCGFDNLSASRFWNVGLTSVEHHIEEKGRNAFTILYERMSGNSTPDNITPVEFSHHLLGNRSPAPFHPSREKTDSVL